MFKGFTAALLGAKVAKMFAGFWEIQEVRYVLGEGSEEMVHVYLTLFLK